MATAGKKKAGKRKSTQRPDGAPSTVRASRAVESEAARAARAATAPDRFQRKGVEVEIRTGEQIEIVIDGTVHVVRFGDGGRPFTSAYVNAMAKDVRDLAEKWVDAKTAREAHWAELAKRDAGASKAEAGG